MNTKPCKKCGKCDRLTPRRGEQNGACRPCTYLSNAKWRAKNKAKDQMIQKYGAIKRAYGLSKEGYDALVESQKGHCAICNGMSSLDVDHDHITGEIRGMLCRPCNTALGLFRDSPDNLKKAIAYLSR